MFKTLTEALDVLMQRYNKTYGIDNLKEAMLTLGNPQHELKIIHIGGTNGKGSTTNFVRTILQEAGYTIGTFTSPHLLSHNDRIRINNEAIADSLLLEYINRSYPMWDTFELSMFEIDMLISVLYFRDQNIDYAVYEVGLGGRLDATNIVHPLVAGITNVGLDHEAILGDTVAKIAAEKAGIMKPGVPLITTAADDAARSVILEKGRTVGAPVTIIDAPRYKRHDRSYTFSFTGLDFELYNQGVYQVNNATLALALVLKILPDISPSALQTGVRTASWAGRFEEVVPNIFLDGAHNDMGIAQLAQSLAIVPKPWIIVFSALRDKHHHDMLQQLLNIADTVIVTEFDFYRAASAQEIASGHSVRVIANYKDAIEEAQRMRGEGTVIVTGSLYFISQAREFLLDPKKRHQ